MFSCPRLSLGFSIGVCSGPRVSVAERSLSALLETKLTPPPLFLFSPKQGGSPSAAGRERKKERRFPTTTQSTALQVKTVRVCPLADRAVVRDFSLDARALARPSFKELRWTSPQAPACSHWNESTYRHPPILAAVNNVYGMGDK